MSAPLLTLDDVPRILERDAVPGLSLAYSTGDEIVTHAWGLASEDRPVSPETLFQAGSISKPVTAFAALGLVAEGRLDLDADVNSVLSSWRLPAVDGWEPAITLRMLLAHVSGVGDVGVAGRVGDAELPIAYWAPPSVMFSYSGDGYFVVSALIAEASGMPFAEAMSVLVLEPLRMTGSTYESPLPAAFRARAAHGHGGGKPVPGGWSEQANAAASGLWTTASDLIRFADAINSGAAPEMVTGHPVEPSMGLGLFLTSADGIDWWSHGGSVRGAFQSLLAGSTSGPTPFSVATMMNSGDDSLAQFEILHVVSKEHGPGPIVIRHAVWDDRAAWARGSAMNTQAAGAYALPGGARLVLETTPKDYGQNELVLTLPGQPPIELRRVTIGQWRVPGFESYVMFDAPDAIRLVQGSREVGADRVRE